MINCPSCNKEIADDTAHCGYCGHEIKAKNEKKTMFGMAALDGDLLEKAIQEAREAKKSGTGQSGSGLKIPKPAGNNPAGANGASELPTGPSAAAGASGASGLKLPRPGQTSDAPAAEKTVTEKAAADKSTSDDNQASDETVAGGMAADESIINTSAAADAQADDPDDMGLAPTEMLEFSDEQRAELADARPTIPPQPQSQPQFQSQPPSEPQPEPEQVKTAPLPDLQPAEPKPVAQGGFNQPNAGQEIVAAPQPPSNSGSQSLSSLKDKKGLLIGIGVVVLLAFGGCAISAIYYLYTMIFG